MGEKRDTAVRPLKKTKQHEQQKFRMVRLQTGVQNRADSGTGRQRSESTGRFGQGFPKNLFSSPSNPPHTLGEQRSESAERIRQGFPKKSEHGFVYSFPFFCLFLICLIECLFSVSGLCCDCFADIREPFSSLQSFLYSLQCFVDCNSVCIGVLFR